MSRSSVIRVSVLGDVEELQKAFKAGESSANDFGAKMEAAGKKLTLGVTAPIMAVGVAGFAMAADLADAQGATDQIFKDSANSVKNWAAEFPDYYGIAESEALSHANIMGSLLQNLGGMSEDAAAEQSQLLVALAGDLSAMFGGSSETAVQALTGALKGNTAMLDNYGIAANEASIKSKAMADGIWDGKGAMTQAQKQAATLAIIMEQTAAAQGQAAREAEGASGSMKSLSTGMKEMTTDIGTMLLPVGTQLLGMLQGLMGWFQGLSPEVMQVIVVIAGLAAAIGPVLIVTAKLISAFQAVMGAFKALTAVMMANPWLLLIAAVIALVIIIVKNWDKIKEYLSKVWDWLKGAAEAVGDFFKNAFSKALEFVKNLFLNFTGPGLLIKHFDKIKEAVTGATTWVKDKFTDMVDFLKELPGKVASAVTGLWDAVPRSFKEAMNMIIGAWNRLDISVGPFSIPTWVPVVGGKSFHIRDIFPDIPKFHSGGVFRAPTPGGEGLAILKDMERVSKPGMRSEAGMVVQASIVINAGLGTDPYAVGQGIVEYLQQYSKVNGAIPISIRQG